MSNYRIANCSVSFQPKYALMKKKMIQYQKKEQKYDKADIMIDLPESFLEEQHQKYPHLTIEECEYVWAGIQFYEKLLNYNGFMLHSSAVEVNHEAYLFSANSGVGKSTHVKLWQQLFGEEHAIIINDDKPAICIEENVCYAYGTPFSGKSIEHRNKKVKIKAICMIERGLENTIHKIEKKEAISLILQQTIWPKKVESAHHLLRLIEIVLETVPIYKMKCNQSIDAAKLAYETMRKG